MKTFKPMDKATGRNCSHRSRPYALEGQVRAVQDERTFDGTAQNAAWLGEDVPGVKKLAPTME